MLFRVGTIVGIKVNGVDGIAYVSEFNSTNNTISLKYVNGKKNLTERNNIPVNKVTILVTENGNQLILEVAHSSDNDSIEKGLLGLYEVRNKIVKFNIEDYTEVNGGSRKSRRHKKTNRRRRKSNRRKSRRYKK